MDMIDMAFVAGSTFSGSAVFFMLWLALSWFKVRTTQKLAKSATRSAPRPAVPSAAPLRPSVSVPTAGGDAAALAALVERVSAIEARRAETDRLGMQIAAMAARLAELEAAGGPAQEQAEARIEAGVAEMRAELEGAAEARLAEVSARLDGFDAERTVLMRTVNLEPMRAFATRQVELDTLAERVATLSTLQARSLPEAASIDDEPFLPMPRAAGSSGAA